MNDADRNFQEDLAVPGLKWLAWEATTRCNLNCVHCRSRAGLKGKEAADTGRARFLMDRIAEAAKPVFVLSGGEPLLRGDIFEIASYGAKLGFKMALATNGTLISAEVCKKIKDSGIKTVSVSLDGPDAATHDDFRKQKGAFEKILDGIEEFRKHGIEFIVNSSFTKRNQAGIEGTYRFVKGLGAGAWYMFLVVPAGRGSGLAGELIGAGDYERILRWHLEMEAVETEMLVRPICAPSYYRLRLEAEKASGVKRAARSLSFSPGGMKGCVAAQSIAYLDAEGGVYPCSYFPLSGGNVFKTSFRAAWESELFRAFRGGYRGPCGSCGYLGVCGGCRARSLAESGDFLGGDPYCAGARAGEAR